MTDLRNRMIRQMELYRLAPSTQTVYLWHIRQLAAFHQCPPDQLTPQQIQDFLHHLLTERQLAWSTCNQAMCAFVFFYRQVLKWDAVRLNLPPRKREQKLPQVWGRPALRQLLEAPVQLKHRVMLMTVYGAGLRVGEAVGLQTRDIDSGRGAIRVRQGKGHKDRQTLLSPRLLRELRGYWQTYRLHTSSPWLFIGPDPQRPLTVSSLQKIYQDACRLIGEHTKGGIHSLRHSFATHLLEAGVDVRRIQRLMGHRSIKTTSGYLQVTQQQLLSVKSPLDLLDVSQG